MALYVLPFLATTANDALRISCDATNEPLAAALEAVGCDVVREDEAAFAARVAAERPYNAISPADRARDLAAGCPLAGQFVSLLLCVGHIKSTVPDDEAFVAHMSASPKWLQLRQA